MTEAHFQRRGLAPRPRKMPCEYCGEPLTDPLEEPYNLAFIAHLRANAACMTLFTYGMTALRNEIGIRHGQKPVHDGL